jgi:hypothetical protein
MNANLRHWKSFVQAAEAELEAATNSELKLAARGLLRAPVSQDDVEPAPPPSQRSLGPEVRDQQLGGREHPRRPVLDLCWVTTTGDNPPSGPRPLVNQPLGKVPAAC